MKAPYSKAYYASSQRAQRNKKNDKIVTMATDMASQFPSKDLQRMAVGSQGVSDINYGGHFCTLNCTNLKGGKLTIGLCYENDKKAKPLGV
jgi:DNA gyrase/topoisomerase IV subunit A